MSCSAPRACPQRRVAVEVARARWHSLAASESAGTPPRPSRTSPPSGRYVIHEANEDVFVLVHTIDEESFEHILEEQLELVPDTRSGRSRRLCQRVPSTAAPTSVQIQQ